jgi:hypothetical protein
VASGWNRFVAMRKGDFYGTSTGFMPERGCVWRTPDGRAHTGIPVADAGIPGWGGMASGGAASGVGIHGLQACREKLCARLSL